MRNKVAIVALLWLGGVACGQVAHQPDGGKTAVQQAEPLTIAPAEAYKHWKAHPDKYVILDVRTPSEYQSGHVKGAQNVDYYADFEKAIQSLPKDKVYYLHCASGRRSAAATEILRKHGFKAYNMGGFGAVAQAGFPTE